jgi:hypothetical protein
MTTLLTIGIMARGDHFLRNITHDVAFMSDHVVTLLAASAPTPAVRLAAVRELARRGDQDEDTHEEDSSPGDEDNDPPVDLAPCPDDFVPFGEDFRVPKSLRKRQSRLFNW